MFAEPGNSQPISPLQAQQILADHYGIEGTVSALPGEYDHNFRVTANDGREFVLKVMHPERDPSFIEMQCEALAHLARSAPGLALPRVQPPRTNHAFTRISLKDECGGKQHERLAWLLSFVPGGMLASARPQSPELLASLGCLLGTIDAALQSFSHPATVRDFKWDLARAGWIRDAIPQVKDSASRALLEQVLHQYGADVLPLWPKLRKGVIYGDANDYNVIVNDAHEHPRAAIAVIDFGDMHCSAVVAEPAIAAAYAILGKCDPLAAAAAVVRGFNSVFPLDENDLAALFPLIAMRLAVSVVNSAHRKQVLPADPYVAISERPAWEALARLARIPPRFALAAFRHACGSPPFPAGSRLCTWLSQHGGEAASVIDSDLRHALSLVLDLSVSSDFLGADPARAQAPALTPAIAGELHRCGASVAIGRYDEARLLYSAPQFAETDNPIEERRTIHLGLDLFLDAGSNVRSPLAAVVAVLADNRAPLDYGPVVILRHETEDGDPFFTLFGHLSRESIRTLSVGQKVRQGEVFARIGTVEENGGYPPHLHLQIIADLLELNENFPGVAAASQRAIWTSFSPDPNLLLGIPAERFPEKQTSIEETLAERQTLLGRNLSVSYSRPLKIVRGWKQYLYDQMGRAYLDTYNNVPLVGHSHPKVVDAVSRQLRLLNTNTRYLHDKVLQYARRLTAKLPDPLQVCFFVNSGSEANELAIRLARAYTGAEDVLVLEHAYHGHTSTLVDISPYKFDGPGGRGRKPWVHVAPLADDYRGAYRRGEPDIAAQYADEVEKILHRLSGEGCAVAAFIAESMPSVGGQIVFPPQYLSRVYRHVRSAGGVCIADEVQVGFGRVGTHFWGFETQGVVPDIAVMGKPIGNAFPLAAVVTSPEIACAFDNGMEFFSTFGGNPVACAAGLAVLDVLEEEALQQNALQVGAYLSAGLQQLQARHPLIGDVRGSGLFLGVDLVRSRESRESATREAAYICNRMRDCGVLTGTDGPFHNVLKLRPPLICSPADADLFVATLDSVLAEDAAQP
jgi:4-aminobutyrate aminotransferase-like enzyme/Ser/Thr protein kinase RdoA (MazF antagonist)